MKNIRSAGLKFSVLCVLVAGSMMVSAASPKLGGRPAKSASVAVPTSAAPVERLMIRYKPGVKSAGRDGASPAHERLEAAAQVARSASAAGESGLGYLKSVSTQLHVVTLERPVSVVEAQALMQRLRTDPAVADVVIDRRMKPHLVPNDPRFKDGTQWHLMDSVAVAGGINAAPAWDSASGTGVVVAVVDGGYRPHADLVGNLLAGYDFISADIASEYGGNAFWTANDGTARDSDAMDPGDWVTTADVTAGYCSQADNSSWHGTHVTGILAAVGNNNQDGLGVAYGAKILPVRVLGRCGGYTSDILAGARWAAGLGGTGVVSPAQPAKVLNLSLGVEGACDATTQAVVDEIRAQNVSIVASAGNDGSTVISMPGNCKGVVAVTAHTREGDSADYANVGAGVAISAPGGGNNTLLPMSSGIRGVPSTWNVGTTVPLGDAFAEMVGTSMAAPQAAGVLALMASLRGDVPMATLEALMRGVARAFPLGSYCASNPDELPPGFCGSGMLDAKNAVNALAGITASSTDLEVSQRVSSIVFASGQTVNYTLKVTNWGPQTASNVQLQQSVSAGLQIQSVVSTSGVTVSHDAGHVIASQGTLAAGGSFSLNVTTLVTASSGQVTSSAVVSSTSPDPASANNSDVQISAVVVPVAPASDGGGGCTVAPNGQTDASLVLLALAALLMLVWRRRPAR